MRSDRDNGFEEGKHISDKIIIFHVFPNMGGAID